MVTAATHSRRRVGKAGGGVGRSDRAPVRVALTWYPLPRTSSVVPLLSWATTVAAVFIAVVALSTTSAAAQQTDTSMTPPLLNGEHFKITVIREGHFLELHQETEGGDISYAGYLPDMMRAIASLANFTYELKPPSGFGSQCVPQLPLNVSIGANANSSLDTSAAATAAPYGYMYMQQYNCGTNDVNELQNTSYASDIYLGMFYINLERQLKNWFTIPFEPPYKGTLQMVGTTTGIPTFEALAEAQKRGDHPPACAWGSSAIPDFVQSAFPELQVVSLFGETEDDYVAAIRSGQCPIIISDAPLAAQFVLRVSMKGECLDVNQKPIGVIGEPMQSGLSHYSIGVGKHVDRAVVDTISYWMNVLMVNGTLAKLYEGQGGTGKECGYVLYPDDGTDYRLLSEAAIAGIVLGAVVVLIIIPLLAWHRYRLKRQERRYKKRFVQQIARNIEIGRRPGCISASELTEEVLHIGRGKSVISKDDLRNWIHDIKMNFISERDFEALWSAMDIEGNGEVDVVEFVVFLSACGPEFEEVYEEQMKLPKIERLKLAARRLTNLSEHGEAGVRKIERTLDRSSRDGFKPRNRKVLDTSSSMNLDNSSSFRFVEDPTSER